MLAIWSWFLCFFENQLEHLEVHGSHLCVLEWCPCSNVQEGWREIRSKIREAGTEAPTAAQRGDDGNFNQGSASGYGKNCIEFISLGVRTLRFIWLEFLGGWWCYLWRLRVSGWGGGFGGGLRRRVSLVLNKFNGKVCLGPGGHKVLFVPWNTQVESQEIPGVTGKFGLGVENKTGQRLTEFCQENPLVVENTLFQ